MDYRMNRWAAACLAVSTVAGSTLASDQVGDTESVERVFPVDGLVWHDGAALDGAVSLRFSADGTDWSEEWSNLDGRSCDDADCRIDVTDGRFRAQLGRHVALDAETLAASGFDVTVEVYDDGEWQTLTTPIEVPMVPYAMWTTRGADGFSPAPFSVGGDLQLDATLTEVDGTLTIHDLFATGSSAGAVTATGGLAVTSGPTEIGGDLSLSSTLTVEDLATDGNLIGGEAGNTFGQTSGEVRVGPGAETLVVATDVFADQVYMVDGLGQSLLVIDGSMQLEYWGVDHNQDFFKTFSYEWDPDRFEDTDGVSIGGSTDDWVCWVGGFAIEGADWCTGGRESCMADGSAGSCDSDSDCDGDGIGLCVDGLCAYEAMVQAYTFPNYDSDTWAMSVKGSSDDTDHVEGQWMCARNSLVDVLCSDGDGHLSEDCTDEISAGSQLDGDDEQGYLHTGRWPSSWPSPLGVVE